MPSCRCGEIEDYNQRISLLERESSKINSPYASILVQFESLQEELEDLANECSAAFESNSMGELRKNILEADDLMIEARSELSAAIAKRLKELKDELSNLRKDDQAYHDEQKRLTEEAAKKAAEEAENEDNK